MSLLHASIITFFPEMFPGPLGYSLAGNALLSDIWSYETINIRDFGITKHKNVDDEPYGGGSGLIMRPDVAGNAIDYALSKSPNSKIYYPSPRGKLLKQSCLREIAHEQAIIILCGRFEGVDERVIEEYNATEFSIGDYILSGGELATLVMLDCVIRLLPGVLTEDVVNAESFAVNGEFCGLLEPHLYTRPAIWRNKHVPDILLSGHHKNLKNWKVNQSLSITKMRRPDLLK